MKLIASKYHIAISIALMLCLVLLVARHYNVRNKALRYFPMSSFDISQHELSKAKTVTDKDFALIGSSATAGKRIPPDTSIADYLEDALPGVQVYNLAGYEANALDALAIMNLGAELKIKNFIFGVEPSLFPWGFSSPLLRAQYPNIRSELSPRLQKAVEITLRGKFFSRLAYLQDPTVFPDGLEDIWETIYRWSKRLYGPKFDKGLYIPPVPIEYLTSSDYFLRDIFIAFSDLAKRKNIKLYIFSQPVRRADYQYGSEINQYLQTVKQLCIEFKIPYVDLTNALPDSPEYYADYIHLKPNGNKKIADSILKEFIKQ